MSNTRCQCTLYFCLCLRLKGSWYICQRRRRACTCLQDTARTFCFGVPCPRGTCLGPLMCSCSPPLSRFCRLCSCRQGSSYICQRCHRACTCLQDTARMFRFRVPCPRGTCLGPLMCSCSPPLSRFCRPCSCRQGSSSH